MQQTFGPAARQSSCASILIGHLQSNKAARAAELFDGIDSLDSLRLAERLNEAAGKLGKRLPVLLEVKLSPEETKAGLDPDSEEMAQLLERLPDFATSRTPRPDDDRPLGRAGRQYARLFPQPAHAGATAGPRRIRDLQLDVLSMGMSGDFELAIAEGATRIRVGTALFGKREPAAIRAAAEAERN